MQIEYTVYDKISSSDQSCIMRDIITEQEIIGFRRVNLNKRFFHESKHGSANIALRGELWLELLWELPSQFNLPMPSFWFTQIPLWLARCNKQNSLLSDCQKDNWLEYHWRVLEQAAYSLNYWNLKLSPSLARDVMMASIRLAFLLPNSEKKIVADVIKEFVGKMFESNQESWFTNEMVELMAHIVSLYHKHLKVIIYFDYKQQYNN